MKPIFLRALLDIGALENAKATLTLTLTPTHTLTPRRPSSKSPDPLTDPKEFLDAHPAAPGSPHATLFLWSSALLEYVLWSVLDDDEGSEEKADAAWAKAPPAPA